MSPETARRICEPFATTREDVGGTGLGLAAVRRFIQDVGGEMIVETALGQGSRIRLHFPISS